MQGTRKRRVLSRSFAVSGRSRLNVQHYDTVHSQVVERALVGPSMLHAPFEPISNHLAQSSGNSFLAFSSYACTWASLRTPTQRLFVPLKTKDLPPPSHNWPFSGATLSAALCISSNVQAFTMAGNKSSCTSMSKNLAMRTIPPCKSSFKSLKCTKRTLPCSAPSSHQVRAFLNTDQKGQPSVSPSRVDQPSLSHRSKMAWTPPSSEYRGMGGPSRPGASFMAPYQASLAFS
mmetsp:Transcript_86134/g.248708  ORF Transcript_86134/g.248708 Transcript_86134/m.248708 type:complete len:232 (-) Transcript_86134:431-1126(-)